MKKIKKLKKGIIKKALLTLIAFFLIGNSLYLTMPKNLFKSLSIENKYNIKINYKETKIPEVDNKVKNLINKEKKNFIQEEIKQDKDKKTSLTINENINKYNKIYFITLTITKYNKDKEYGNTQKQYIYDNKEKKFITIENILKDEISLKKLSLMTERLLKQYANDNKIKLDNKLLKKGVSPKKENYNNFYLTNKGVTFILKPNQVINSSNELYITIPWNKTGEIINQKYRKDRKITPKKRDISKYKNKKVVAFTFDDGPNTETTKILLDNLDKYDAKVTFFVLGSRVKNNSKILKRAYEEGNDIGSHTYSHKELIFLKDKQLEKEINKTNEVIAKTIGIEPTYLRPPYGSINSHIKSLTYMHTVCWNVDSLDWKLRDRNKIKKEILKYAQDGDVILLHDIYEESVYGALLAMKELKDQGYNFVTISEMEKIKNKVLDYDTTYFGF